MSTKIDSLTLVMIVFGAGTVLTATLQLMA
jgi:hypothetical protein